jgi:hypothetical protein
LSNVKLSEYESLIAEERFTGLPDLMLGMRLTFAQRKHSLATLLQMTCVGLFESWEGRNPFLDATDPRDKVFGLLGLAADRSELERNGVVPNYALSCKEVYANTAAALIEQGHVFILSSVHFPKAQQGLPSWAPDWSVPIKHPLQRTIDGISSPKYHASNGLIEVTLVYQSTGIARRIALSGLIHDTIYATGKSFDNIASKPINGHNSWTREWLNTLSELTLLRGSYFRDENERKEAILRTSTADCSSSKKGWTRMTPELKLAGLIALFDGLGPEVIEASGLGAVLQNKGFFSGITEEVLRTLNVYEYEGNVGSRARGRVPFITAKGNLGLGPKGLQKKDIVAVLAGSEVPFVLRAVSGQEYEMIGEAYVDGIMDGEACSKGDTELKMIHLT